MSRRKQSNPRQIKRSLGDMEEGEDNQAEDASQSEREGGASDPEAPGECEPLSPPCSETETQEGSEGPKEVEEQESDRGPEEASSWNGPDELELISQDGENKVRAKRNLPEGISWGPFSGNIQSEGSSPGQTETNLPMTLLVGEEHCWLTKLPLVSNETDANSVIFRKDEAIWCKTTKPVPEAGLMNAFVMAEPRGITSNPVKAEPGDPEYPATMHSDIQLLPQQAGMAAILATAVVNKDIFPCKDCGIWYRSERNLQAHLMYYCASRQSSGSPLVEEKPKETYPNERVCPFPQCKKSCPSASSLEIHMRSHSGERPFVCLICLSAFTTKANCERHLKVHTDTLSGICHSCGFVSTTRDILYSHLVTNHMICQPGSKGEIYSPSAGHLAAKPGPTGLAQASSTPSLKCGLLADSLASLQQHMALHGPLPTPDPSQAPPSSESPAPPDTLVKKAPAEAENGDTQAAPQESCSSSSSASGEGAVPLLRIKEEVGEGQGQEPEMVKSHSRPEQGASPRSEPESSSRTSSPQSLASVKVKSELASPTPGSSPVPSEAGVGPSGGTIFLPQYMFGPETSVVPQASEILAKMSELVHSRLKQGHGGVAPGLYPGTPAPKGATCFECEITFSNINNYYVHKRLYCSSRHVAEGSPPGARKPKVAGPPKGPPGPAVTPTRAVLSPQPPEGQGPPAPAEGEVEGEHLPLAADAKAEGAAGGKEASPEADGTGRGSEDSQSPRSSVDDTDEDPMKTVCEACNIRFSRHETYTVHKRYYCASRHDPPLRRPGGPNKAAFLPQPARTRKRRKLYEIHAATSNAGLLPATHPPPPPPPPPPLGELPTSPQLGISPADALALGARPDVPPALLLPVGKAPTSAPSPSSSPDTDGPIDLSKKPRLHKTEGAPTAPPPPPPPPLLPLTDYHECTACCVSFHSLEAYLAHKKYYCPAAPLQQSALEQLQKIQGLAKPRLAREGPRGVPGEELEGGVRVKVEKGVASASPGPSKTSGLPVAYAGGDPLHRYPGPKALHLPGGKPPPPMVCPYCPLNGAIKGDLIEHFRHAHGLLVAKPVAGHILAEATTPHPRTPAENSLPAPLSLPPPTSSSSSSSSSSSPQPGPRLPRDSFNGHELKESPAPANGSPLPTSSPRPGLPLSPATVPALTLSPVPEALLQPPTPPMYTDKGVQTPSKVAPATVPNGNHRYCRLCNIKFSSLSTFIAHKKYYCSSHAAEHVK
ncbi:zinc finger protein ZFPM1 [Notamacropus eugenii]|uniref:zinc finger protein ZFPM1 n=1 Tax=Notamacropus eugenii TaxID=9315 RepID=UPI003B680EC8